MNMIGEMKNSLHKLQLSILLIASACFLSGCMQSNAASQFLHDSDSTVTEPMLKSVNSAFRTTILGGDWYYQGAQAVNGTINVYIQIPDKLNMSRDEQEKYLKMSLCPSSAKKYMWQKIKDVPLSVHVYTMNKSHTVFAHCDNPIVEA